jgi:hypothetical protein
MGKQKRYSLEFWERAVRRMKLGDNVSRLAHELGVDRTSLYTWNAKWSKDPTAVCCPDISIFIDLIGLTMYSVRQTH